MKVIRIHSVGFRRLFCLYHAFAALGCVVIIMVFCLSANQSYAHMLLFVAGILMMVLPLFLAPPEIILDLKEKMFVFRKGMKCSKIYFSEIKDLTIDTGIMRILDYQNTKPISIHQNHFHHIPLPKMRRYIHEILAGNSKIDKWQFNAVKIKCRLLFG